MNGNGSASWVQLRTNFFDDDRVKLIRTLPEGDTLTVIYFQMLALAGRCNAGGRLLIHESLAHDEVSLTACMGKSASIINLALASFVKYGLLLNNNGCYEIADWYSDQNSEKLAEIQAANARRQANYRLKHSTQNLLPQSCNVTGNVTGNVIVTGQSKNKKREEEEQNIRPLNPPKGEGSNTELEKAWR